MRTRDWWECIFIGAPRQSAYALSRLRLLAERMGAWEEPAFQDRSGNFNRRLFEQILVAENNDVDAVFVANDQMALGLLRAFEEAGIDVPGQVSVAGFDDIPEAEYFTPPLTTIRQDFAAVGRHSIALLLDRIGQGPPGREPAAARVVVPTTLIPRASTHRRPS
jgi:DNA-binding LacI/PurR family transcriptional regulator